jgi:hypothetical protein
MRCDSLRRARRLGVDVEAASVVHSRWKDSSLAGCGQVFHSIQKVVAGQRGQPAAKAVHAAGAKTINGKERVGIRLLHHVIFIQHGLPTCRDLSCNGATRCIAVSPQQLDQRILVPGNGFSDERFVVLAHGKFLFTMCR